MDIHEAYEVYRQITCEFKALDRIPEIFTEDVISGNAIWGQIRGIEAQKLFLTTGPKMGLVPEDHLSCMITGNDLAFRARNWAGAKGASRYFDTLGHLIFDPDHGRFAFYYGFHDPAVVADVLGSSESVDFSLAGGVLVEAQAATRRFNKRNPDASAIPEFLRVPSAIDSLGS